MKRPVVPIHVPAIPLVWLLSMLGACVGTSTGNPADGAGSYQDANSELCDASARDIDDDDDSALGFAAEQILDFAAATHAISLRWRDTELGAGPETGDGTLTLTVSRGAGPTQYLDREPRSTRMGEEGGAAVAADFATGDPSGCSDALAIPVDVEIHTAGGALDERVTTSLLIQRPEVASLRVSLPYELLAGSLTLQLPQTDALERKVTIGLDAQLSTYGVTGTVQVTVEERTDDAVSQGDLQPIASFPADSPCMEGGIEVDDHVDVGTYTPGDLAAELERSLSDLAITWSDDAVSALSLTLVARLSCLDLQAAGQVVEMTAQAQLHSADDRVDTSLPVMLVPTLDAGGDVTEVSLQTVDAYAARPVGEIAAAVPEVDLSGFDGGIIDLQGTFSRNASGDFALHGGLRVAGTIEPDCGQTGGTQGPFDSGSGAGSAGCAGVDEQDLLQAVIAPAM